jgi:hypothetical protein
MARPRVAGPISIVAETYGVIHAETFVIGVGIRQVHIPAPAARRLEASTTLIQADPGNGGNVRIGNAVAQPIVLEAGSSITIAADPSTIYVAGNGQRVNWLALGY